MFTPRNDSPLKQIESKIIDHLELNVGLLIWTESITSDTFASYNMLYLVKLNKSNELDYYDVSELESRVDYETLKTDLIYQKELALKHLKKYSLPAIRSSFFEYSLNTQS